jgi:catechol 2,3-dioxygenase-like lactoylglutathione lyase family enzyme
MNPFHHVVIGVANLEHVLTLWVDVFGMELVARRDGSDAELARLWQLDDSDIRRQALVAAPGQRLGMLHFVEFQAPGPPVRRDASATDACPKNLDVYADDLPQKMRELVARGYRFRNSIHSEVTAPDGTLFREAHMHAHDDINVVLLEVPGWQVPYSERGFAAVGLLITIVPDTDREKRFYRDVLGLGKLGENLLEGPEIERMVGLPPGAAMDASIWGQKDNPMGQIEIIEYRGAGGNNLFPRARPKSLGILHVGFESADIGPLRGRLSNEAVDFVDHGPVSTLAVRGNTISFLSPAGLRIEVTAPI